jgi:signal transduction histidine kinase
VNRPWQIWLMFSAALLVVLGAVGWLSFKALQSDASETIARKQAAQEEKASLALWRMDSFMTPIVAQESARPYFEYNAFYSVEQASGRQGKGKAEADVNVPSPLLIESTPYVTLHFQINPQGQFNSPEVPQGKLAAAAADYLPEDQRRGNSARLLTCEGIINTQKILENLPEPGLAATMASIPIQVAAQNGNFSPATANAFANAPNGPPPLNQAPFNQAQVRQDANPDANGVGQQQIDNGQLQQPPAQMQQLAQEKPNQRGQLELQARTKQFVQSNASKPIYGSNNDFNNSLNRLTDEVHVSMMKPLWIDGQLVLARRVKISGADWVQGCLLDWDGTAGIKQQLLSDVKDDLLPNADLQPLTDGVTGAEFRRMASLPVMLIPGLIPADPADGGLSPIKLSLLVAWAAMAVAGVAAAMLLRGVVALSERRAAFVSAVTHELRTPLTTFRMYAEMLGEGMVREETDRRHYLDTLRVEADRLTHLVANVLAYARLERGRPGGRIETMTVERLLEIASERLAGRAAQAQLRLSVELPDDILNRGVRADPAAVEQILFNLVDNACKYAASATDRTLHLSADADNGRVSISLRDHGNGIDPQDQRRLFQAFHKSAKDAANSAPGVGLGLALSLRLARDMGGDLRYDGDSGGACFVLTLPSAV